MRRLALCAAALWAGGAGAAELPSRALKARPPEAKARECRIGGERGVATTSGLCVRVSGYVSVGVSSGALRH